MKNNHAIEADRAFSKKLNAKKRNSKHHLSYTEQLKRPEWMARRTQILKRDGYQCQGIQCDLALDGEHPILHVHHRFYQAGLMAWEYPDYCYVTLCPECHSVETEFSNDAMNRLKHAMARKGYSAREIISLCERIEAGE